MTTIRSSEPAPYKLGAALMACGICMPRPEARNWVLADRMTDSRAFPNATVQVRFDGVKATDSKGRIAHVRGIYIAGAATVTTVDDNTEITGYGVRSIINSIFLKDVTGHLYLNNVDGRTILDDQFFRFGSLINWPYLHFGVQGLAGAFPQPDVVTQVGLAADTAPGAHDLNLSLYIPLTRPNGKCGNPMEGLIPLAALQRVGPDAMTFRLNSTFAPAPTGVTVNGFTWDGTQAGLEVWLDLVYLDAFVIDAPWQLQEYTQDQRLFVLNAPTEITEYAWIRYFPEDAAAGAGQALVQQLDQLTLSAAGMNSFAGFVRADLVRRQILFQMSQFDSAWTRDNAAQYLPMLEDDGDPLALMLVGYPKRRDAAPAGPVNVQINTMGTATFVRIVQRNVACHTQARGEKLANALKCDPCSITYTDHGGNACATPVNTAPVVVTPNVSGGSLSLARG